MDATFSFGASTRCYTLRYVKITRLSHEYQEFSFREKPQTVSLVSDEAGEGGMLLGLTDLDNEVDVRYACSYSISLNFSQSDCLKVIT